MSAPRPFALLSTADQWRRAAFQNTALEDNVVQLAWIDTESAGSSGGSPPVGAGLAFDCECRLYHSIPEGNRIDRILWAQGDPLRPSATPPESYDLFGPGEPVHYGEFGSTTGPAPPVSDPRGICVDSEDRLFIAEYGNRRIIVFDLFGSRLVRAVPCGGNPASLAVSDLEVCAAIENPMGLVRLDAYRDPVAITLPSAYQSPVRLAFTPDGKLWILSAAGTAAASVFPLHNPSQSLSVPFATDLAFLDDPTGNILVVARMPGDDFLRYLISETASDEMPPLTATLYDGRGIVVTPSGRIGYWTPKGLRNAVAARLRYLDKGRVTTFQLDCGEFFTTWGRIFIDACIPAGTDLRVNCIATDDPPDGAVLARTPPANVGVMVVPRPDLSPPMIPLTYVPATVSDPVYRRDTGPETPWVRFAANDNFRTYEAPIQSDPGRYLWVTVELSGNTRATPRLRAIRAEYPWHDYLRKLPRTFSRDARAASFLLRYLGTFEGELNDWQGRSDARRTLIESTSSQDEILPWLAGFVGLTLDERWSVAVRRQLIAAAVWLFRFRGTIPGLLRFLEICTGGPVAIVEDYRLRGGGGAVLGDTTTNSSILGAGFQIGGAVGDNTLDPISDTGGDAFETHAHRFTVLIQSALSQDQQDMVQHLLDVHRPAHTVVEVCTLGAGMRVGRGLLVGLTSIIGPTGGFKKLQVGGSLLGRATVLGQALAGTVPGATRLGRDSQVG